MVDSAAFQQIEHLKFAHPFVCFLMRLSDEKKLSFVQC